MTYHVTLTQLRGIQGGFILPAPISASTWMMPEVGNSFRFYDNNDELITTTHVKSVERTAEGDIIFETRNSRYQIHVNSTEPEPRD